jgi:hypothetical protein
MPARRIGEILVAEGALTEAAVNRALGYQRVSGDRLKLGTILLHWDMLAEDGLLGALARHYRVPAAPWPLLDVAPIAVTRLLQSAIAIRLGAFPYALSKAGLHVAFLDPTNLTAQDEISMITGKRVIPAVALEIRMLQAHQKFYGRHIPLEYRSIVQRMDRRSTKTKASDWQDGSDFRARDLIGAEKQPEPPPPPPIRVSREVPVEPGLGDVDLIRGPLHIQVPEMPMPGARTASDRLSDTDPAALGKKGKKIAGDETMSDTKPVGHTQAPESPSDRPSPAVEGARGDDTLPKRMGPRFASLSSGEDAPAEAQDVVEPLDFQPESAPRHPSRRATDRPSARRALRPPQEPGSPDNLDDTLPRGAAAHLVPRDFVADMWRPSPEEQVEEAESRMWAPSAAEIEASIGEARTRDEIGQVALEAFLGDFPRVLLLGCGKEAITVWQGRGPDLPAETVATVRIPLSEPCVFSEVRATGVPHFGPLEPAQWPKSLAAVLGQREPDCAVFPIRILDGIAAFLYADRLGEALHYEDFAVVARASAATANALARFLLRRNNPAPVV